MVPTLQSIFTGSCRTDGTLDHDATLLPAKLPSAEQEPAFSLAEKGTDGTIQVLISLTPRRTRVSIDRVLDWLR